MNVSEYYKLNDFLDKYEIKDKDEINIINQGFNPKKYNIPNDHIDELFNMLNNLKEYNLNFSEKQKECNGIFIDIDRYNKRDIFSRLIDTYIYIEIYRYIDIDV